VTANVQRRKDNVCLARTLSLLFRLAEHRCDQSYQLQLLQQTLARSLSLSMGSLSTQTMLDTAKHYLLHPRESVGVASIPWPRTLALGEIHSFASEEAAAGRPQAQPEAVWRLIHASLSAATCTSDSPTESALLTSQALVASANVWSIYGNTTMANLASKLQLDIHRTHNLNSGLDGAKSSNLLVSTKLPTSDACASLCALAKSASEKGDYSRAFALLAQAHQEYPQSTSQPQWIRAVRQILQEQALRREDFKTAEIQAIQLSALSPLNLDLHQHIDALYRLAVVLMHKREWTKAMTLVQSLIETCEGGGLTLQAIPFRLTLAEILLRSQNALAAVAPLLQCLTLAREFRLDTIFATASVQLAHVHLLEPSDSCHHDLDHSQADANQGNDSLRRARKAIDLLDAVMPHILQHGPRLLQAQAQLEFVKAELILSSTAVIQPLATSSGANENQQPIGDQTATTPTLWRRNASYEVCTASLDQIEEVIDIATSLQATQLLVEAYYFKARLANALGLHVQRNLAARMFKELQLAPLGTSPSEALRTERNAGQTLQNPCNGSMHYYLDVAELLSHS
jgi:tetratricopeptide (TPR) repeat protein